MWQQAPYFSDSEVRKIFWFILNMLLDNVSSLPCPSVLWGGVVSGQVDAHRAWALPSCPVEAWLFPVHPYRIHLHLLREVLLNWSDMTYQTLHLLN